MNRKRAVVALVFGASLVGMILVGILLREPAPLPKALQKIEVHPHGPLEIEAEACIEPILAALDPLDALELARTPPEELIGKYHLGLGMAIRNRCGLRANSKLARRFREAGVNDPERMSSYLIRVIHLRVRNEPASLEHEIKTRNSPPARLPDHPPPRGTRERGEQIE